MLSFLPYTDNIRGRTGFELSGQRYKPTTGEVLGAYANATLTGPGSTVQDVAQATIARETGNEDQIGIFQRFSEGANFVTGGLYGLDVPRPAESRTLSEDEWKESPHYREGMSYTPGTTTYSAAIQANIHDREVDNAFYIKRASGIQTVAGVGAGLVSGFLDAKALAAGAVTTAASPLAVGVAVGLRSGVAGTAGVSRLLAGASSIGKATIQATRTRRALDLAVQSTVSTVPMATTGLQNAALTGQEYGLGDAAMDFATGAGVSVGLDYVGAAIGATWRRYARPEQKAQIAEAAARQIAAGEKIDVGPLVRAGVADFTPSRITPEEPTVRKVVGDGPQDLWEAALQNQVFRGKTKTEVEAAAREFSLSESLESVRQAGYDARTVAQIESLLRVKESADPRVIEETIVRATPEVRAAEAKLRQAEEATATVKPKQKKSAEAKVQAARAELQEVEARTRAAVQPEVARQREVLQRRQAEADKAIRDIQSREAAKRLPDYMKRQLDSSPEARAERSADPNMREAQRDRVSEVRYDEEAPTKPLDDAEKMELLEASKTDPQVARFSADAELMARQPEAILKYARCRAGL